MAARIRSLRNGLTPIDDASRDDLVVGDVVTVTAIDPATTYAWSLVFVPDGSTAAFSGDPTAVSPGTFTVDLDGPYLVRLVTNAGTGTESAQYVRLRSLTAAGLRLVAAGERRDNTGIIPVDATPEGWANDQNFNLQLLETLVAPFYTNVWPAWKKPCRVATIANVAAFAGGAPLVVDGVTVTTGDRVLVPVQTAGAENGIYRVVSPGTGADGGWVRDSDFNASSEVVAGLLVYVQEGSQNGRTRFTLVTTGAINLGATPLVFIQEAPLVRTDATSTVIIPAGTAFTNGTIVWSSAVDTRDYSEISVWFGSANIGANTQVDLYAQWSDDGSTIPFGDDDGIQQTDFLITTGTNGVFQPKDYVARLTVAGGELIAGSVKMLSFPKKGGSFRFGVMGDSATGTFGVRAQRLA